MTGHGKGLAMAVRRRLTSSPPEGWGGGQGTWDVRNVTSCLLFDSGATAWREDYKPAFG